MIVLHAFTSNINSIILYISFCNLLFITLYFIDVSMLKHAELMSSLIVVFYCVKYPTIYSTFCGNLSCFQVLQLPITL